MRILFLLISLGLGQNQSFGPKENTKFGVSTTHHPPSTHLPKTFWRVLDIVGSQDFLCRLPLVQGTSAHSVDPPPSKILDTKHFWVKNIWRGGGGAKLWAIVPWTIGSLNTKSWPPTMPRILQKVLGGWWAVGGSYTKQA